MTRETPKKSLSNVPQPKKPRCQMPALPSYEAVAMSKPSGEKLADLTQSSWRPRKKGAKGWNGKSR